MRVAEREYTMRPPFLALSCMFLAACGSLSRGAGTVPAQAPEWSSAEIPRALHFVPFVGTCAQSGSNCSAGAVQSLLKPTTKITVGISYPYTLLFDKIGNLYVANLVGNTVTVYPADRTTPKETIRQHVSNPVALAFDDTSQKLYVANNCSVQSTGACSKPNTLTVYHRGRYKFTIADKVNQPVALALDPSGNVFVANQGNNTVTEYSATTHALMRTIRGLHRPTDIAIGTTGTLYVANNLADDVAIYSPNSATPSRTITIPQPYRLTVDHKGNLYVGTPSLALVYCPPCSKPSRIINHVSVVALAVNESNQYLYVANGGLMYSTQNVQVYTPGTTSPLKTISISQTISALALQPVPATP